MAKIGGCVALKKGLLRNQSILNDTNDKNMLGNFETYALT